MNRNLKIAIIGRYLKAFGTSAHKTPKSRMSPSMTFLALVFVFCSLCQALTRLFALFFLTRSPHYLRPWNAIEDYSFTQIDPIHDNRHLCTRSRTDGIKAMSLGFSGGKQVKKIANGRDRG